MTRMVIPIVLACLVMSIPAGAQAQSFSQEPIGTCNGIQQVIAGSPIEHVNARSPEQLVIAGSADQKVVAFLPF